jgi:hypothetical protein
MPGIAIALVKGKGRLMMVKKRHIDNCQLNICIDLTGIQQEFTFLDF